MKLIIEIPDEMYKRIQDDIYSTYDGVDSLKAVRNGTPLDDITAELTEWHNMKHSSLSDANYQIMLDIIDRHIGERSEE